MTNNTIPNVPRELLERVAKPVLFKSQEDAHADACAELRAHLSAPSPAGVDGLGNTAKLLLPALRQYMHNDGSGLLAGYDLETTQAIIDGLRGEVADLHTTMMAAAVEIQEHWAAHCDEEGYGPANLMHRLERGIASQYGYRAETLVRLESQRDQQAQRIGELEGLLRHAQKQVPTGSGLHMRIDAALSAVCAAAPNIATTSEHSSQPERDPCPMCIKGGICNTPTCGRLLAMPKAY